MVAGLLHLRAALRMMMTTTTRVEALLRRHPQATARPSSVFAQHLFRDPPAPVPHTADELRSVRLHSLSHWLLTSNILPIVTMLAMFNCTAVEPNRVEEWRYLR